MRRSLALLVSLATGTAGLALATPAAAQTAPTATPAPAPAAASAPAPEPEAVPGELLVGYVRGATESDKERARGRAAAVRQDDVVHGQADRGAVELVRLPQGKARGRAVAELQSDPAVAYAEPNWVYTHQSLSSSDPYLRNGQLWGLHSATPTVNTAANPFGTAAVDAWKAGSSGSKAVYVGVIDEGIQVTHPDLKANVWVNPFDRDGDRRDNDGNGYVDDVNGWDFDGGNKTVYDGGTRGTSDDHGTHVAGTIGAANDGSGVVGMNHDVTLISAKFLGSRGGTAAAAAKALDYFTDLKQRHKLNIVATNNSWGGGGYSQALLDAIRRANAVDILFIAAAGNSGTDNDAATYYPAGYDVPNVVSVAAIDKNGALASFSQYGAKTVDLGAPGVDVWSTTAFNGYSTYNGTSMATPHVTGAAALYAATFPTANAAAVKKALLDTAVPTSSLLGRTVTGGRLHAANALTGTVTPRSLSTPQVQVARGATDASGYRELIVSWSGYTGAEVRVDANGRVSTTANDGSTMQKWSAGTVTFTVCETDGTACASASITT